MTYSPSPPRRHLGSEIGDEGARSLAEALKHNTTLSVLNLSRKLERGRYNENMLADGFLFMPFPFSVIHLVT